MNSSDLIAGLAGSGHPFTADDVDAPNARALLLRASAAGIIVPTGRKVRSGRGRRHLLTEWVGADTVKRTPEGVAWRMLDAVSLHCPLCGRKAATWRGNVQHMKLRHGLGTGPADVTLSD